ncbi:MAG TPA: thermonuclease family protein [Gaiellaceae bacterium]|nr:thermonuclease family protein [Gaiellaceae bacterium]
MLAVAVTLTLVRRPARRAATGGPLTIDHVADGDTVDLTNHETIRLVQIDTPEVYFTPECYGEQASAETKRLLPPGTVVRLVRDPATDAKDQYGRLLRYVIRASDGLDVNLRLVADGAAAPYFFDGVRGMYATQLLADADAARSAGLGLWGACPRTQLEPDRGVSTGPPD